MTPENECFPDPRDMSDEDKLELIEALHEANHFHMEAAQDAVNNVISLAYGMLKLAEMADDGDRLGRRGKTLDILAHKMSIIAGVSLATYGVTQQDVEETDKFADIVSQLEDDPEFNKEGEEDGT